MQFSPQQDQAIKAVSRWLRDRDSQVFYLAGFAGTGKTTLAKTLASDVKGQVLYGAFTGKAALVLRRKGCSNASTIHSMIYKVKEGETWQPRFALNPSSDVRDAKLVIIDECSMVGEELGRDLLSFGTKVLVLGDPAQLPPVKGEGFFTARQPDFMLTDVHRQAAENPIIRMSMTVREGGRLSFGDYGVSRVIPRDRVEQSDVMDADIVLCGKNRSRRSYNARIRTLLGRDDPLPVPQDRLVCLKNDREKKLLNGGLWEAVTVKRKNSTMLRMTVRSDDAVDSKPTDVEVLSEFFTGDEKQIPWEATRGTQQLTFGYALTVHKSQGSQWDDVYVFDESDAFRENRKEHLYTAITRAAERVTIVQS